MWWRKKKEASREPQTPGGSGSAPPGAAAQDNSTMVPEAVLPESSSASPGALPRKTLRWRRRMVRWGWLLVGLLWALPTLLLIGAGSWWLWQEGWLWRWLGLTGALSLVGWFLAQWLRQTSRDTWGILVQPDPRWTPLDQAAWEKIEALAVQLQQSALSLEDPESVLRAFHEVLATVARHYRPDSERPELEIPAPHVLRIIERVAADLRQLLLERVPGSHWLTLHDLYKLSRLAAWFQRFYRWFYGAYRVTQLATNPAAALVREVRDAALGQVQASTAQELKEGVISFCVRQAGRYAIELYSGKVLLEGDGKQLPLSRQTRRQLPKEGPSTPAEEEPIRVLLLGGVGSGKHIFIQMLTGPWILPKQSFWNKLVRRWPMARRWWQPEGLPPFLLTDWPEYDGSRPASPKQFAAFDEEVLQTDLVLLVCQAMPSSWTVDRSWLDRIRNIYRQHPERNPPALMVVLVGEPPTCQPTADQPLGVQAPAKQSAEYRPADQSIARRQIGAWPSGQSAYELLSGRPTTEQTTSSDRSVSDLLAELRRQLALSVPEPVVLVCPAADSADQIQRQILAAMQQLLPEAERARYARYYAQYDRQERLPHLFEQVRRTAPQAGKVATRQVSNLIKQTSQALWQWGTRWLRREK